MTSDILFSIIMPVYNRESCVHSAIESVLNQSYGSFELLLIDDGSTDKTEAVCLNYANADSRIKYFKKENGGVSTARNLGLKNIGGNYILFLDSDDSLSSNALNVLRDKIQISGTDTDIIVFGTKSVNHCWKATSNTSGEIQTESDIAEKYLPTHINIFPQKVNFVLNYIWNKCYKAEFIKNNHLLFDEGRRTWEDGLFVVECLSKAKSMFLIPDILHTGCTDINIEHLSSKFYPSQINLYIQDETNFKNIFENRYDFKSIHYCRSNINTLNLLFSSAYKNCKKESKDIIATALCEPIILHWISNLTPINRYEKFLKFCVTKKKYNWMVYFYKFNLLKNKVVKNLND